MSSPAAPGRRLLHAAVLLSMIAIIMTAPMTRADEDAATILAKTGAFYAEQNALAADFEVKLEMPPQFSDMGQLPTFNIVYWFQAPNNVAFIATGPGEGSPFIQDGKQLYSPLPMMNSYILRDAATVEGLVGGTESEFLQMPGASALLGLGTEAGTPGSLRSATAVELIAEEQVDGIDCYRLAVTGEEINGEIWVAKGEQPWVLRIIRPAPDPADAPAADGIKMIQPGTNISISNWRTEPEFGDVFDINPPADMTSRATVPSMEEMMANAGAPMGDHGGSHSTVDTAAPAIKLQPLDGEALDLASLKGKVVVLDFWATWCKPCVMALPVVTQVTTELADQGVVFYAVNQRESEDVVRKFLADKGLDMAVAMDPKGNAGRAFGVDGIPHSVLIDKKGMIRKVHVGFGPGMDQLLKTEIEELLAE